MFLLSNSNSFKPAGGLGRNTEPWFFRAVSGGIMPSVITRGGSRGAE